MSSSRSLALVGLLALGCRVDPEPSATGDRVDFNTDVVAKVCRGTIEHIDAEIERIESELMLPATSDRAEVHVVDVEHIGELCGGRQVCVVQPPRRIYLTPERYEEHIRYELVRDRVSKTAVGASKPVFFEGLAGALARPSCEPITFIWEPPPVDHVLAASNRDSLGDEGRYLGGELVRWLLDTRGPEQLFALMREVSRYASADEVRVAYLERIGGSIDADLFAHWRPSDVVVDPGRAGCLGVEPAPGEVGSRVRLQAELDCDSPRVRNDFRDPSRVFVEWIFDTSAREEGNWSLVDELPEGVTLTISECRCVSEPWSFLGQEPERPWAEDNTEWLGADRHRLRVYAPIGTKIDIQLQGPCDFAARDCPAGQQCAQFHDCLDEVDDPGQLGDPCWPALGYDETPLPCAAGLVCGGPAGDDGICMGACYGDDGANCGDEQSCLNGLVCGDSCDPLAPSGCGEGWACYPNFAAGVGGCVPAGELALLEPCSVWDFACEPGLVCDNIPGLAGCHDPDAWFDFNGCCTPTCDPAAPDPGCPAELPACLSVDDRPFGLCGLP